MVSHLLFFAVSHIVYHTHSHMGIFNQSISYKIVLHHAVRKGAVSSLYLRIIINQVKKEISLNIKWPREKFDAEKQIVLSRHSNDTEVDGINMMLAEAKGRANRIKMRYFSENKLLSADQFVREFNNYESRDNFLFYMKQKMDELLQRDIITRTSYVAHNTNRNRLIAFNKSDILSMADITPDFVKQYQKWLRKKKTVKIGDREKTIELSHNTAMNALKVISTYIHHAQGDGYLIKTPFEKIPLNYQPGQRYALDRDELAALKNLMAEAYLQDTEREVLRKFLFSCYCGIRISDSALIYSSQIKDGVLTLYTKKGRNHGKHISIPLPEYARELIKGRDGQLFDKISDQKCNMWLKVLAHKAGISKKLTFHVSRDTFATLFIELGGDVATLKEILGHSDVKTTMIYVKMSEKRKELLMSKFDSL